MSKDTIIEEIHKYREEYAKSFNYDLEAIYQDLKAKQEKSTHPIVSLPPKIVKNCLTEVNNVE